MITTTTTTRSHRGRRVAAAVLVGLGLVSLGVASASRLNVEADGDLVASGVTTDLTGFLGPDATADVKVTYADVDADEKTTDPTALATANTLPATVTLTIAPDGGTIPDGSTFEVFFYNDVTSEEPTTHDPVAHGTAIQNSGANDCENGCAVTMSPADALPQYDRVAVVAVSGDYGD